MIFRTLRLLGRAPRTGALSAVKRQRSDAPHHVSTAHPSERTFIAPRTLGGRLITNTQIGLV
jgi:hypothetical protein